MCSCADRTSRLRINLILHEYYMGHESVGSRRPQIITDSLSSGLQRPLELCRDSVMGLGGLQNLDCAVQFRLGTFNLPIIIRERVIIFISHKSDITASCYKSTAPYIRSSIKRFGTPKTVNNSGTKRSYYVKIRFILAIF